MSQTIIFKNKNKQQFKKLNKCWKSSQSAGSQLLQEIRAVIQSMPSLWLSVLDKILFNPSFFISLFTTFIQKVRKRYLHVGVFFLSNLTQPLTIVERFDSKWQTISKHFFISHKEISVKWQLVSFSLDEKIRNTE